jgi:hypothetical protein
MGKDQEVVKRSGRDEPMWVAIQKCVETILGISPCSYLYLKQAKTLCFFMFSTKLENKRAEQVLPGVCEVKKEGGGPNNVYTCK